MGKHRPWKEHDICKVREVRGEVSLEDQEIFCVAEA